MSWPREWPSLTGELIYVLLLFALFVVPKALERFRVPTAVTAFALGAASGLGLHWFEGDHTVELLSAFGIVSLFLFAGLDVDLHELRNHSRVLLQHLALRLAGLAAVAYGVATLFALEPRPAALVALALLTPSTGFILDSLDGLGLGERERFWVRSKAIATELLALAVLFITLQSTTLLRLALSALVLAAMVALLPRLFRLFATAVAPFAPKSEFAFLVMVAIACALVTRELGVYYLVGAFVVGMAAQQFREHLPTVGTEKMLHAVEAFASFFVPFYFFHAGLELRREDFGGPALLAGLLFVVLLVPARILLVWLPRLSTLRESFGQALRVSVPMLPTLVFTLVIVHILRERFAAPAEVLGGLVLYALATTVLPSILVRVPPPDFDSPALPSLPGAAERGLPTERWSLDR
jgi:Kef-type K+ transport system membrane component KefB